MTCSRKNKRLLHALLDGELDAMNAADYEAHLAACDVCTAEYERQTKIRSAIRTFGPIESPPQQLRGKIEDMIDGTAAVPQPSDRTRPAWSRGLQSNLAKGLALALAAGLALFVLLPTGGDSVRDQVVSSHVRSLLAAHLTDVETSDRHTVRPWFSGKVDVAPPVVDLGDIGFPLVGGRLDYIENHVVAALVYKRDSHVINLFIRSAPDQQDIAPRKSSFRGYNLCQWRRDGVEYWAVTDAGTPELETFQAAYERASGAT